MRHMDRNLKCTGPVDLTGLSLKCRAPIHHTTYTEFSYSYGGTGMSRVVLEVRFDLPITWNVHVRVDGQWASAWEFVGVINAGTIINFLVDQEFPGAVQYMRRQKIDNLLV